MKDTTFLKEFAFHNRGQITVLRLPAVMGILNLTPDSFYDGGNFDRDGNWMKQVQKMMDEGMDLLDLGASSSRPGADSISEAEELNRLMPVLTEIRNSFPTLLISIDTYRSNVARMAIEAGANIINDISGGNMDANMFGTIAKLKVPYVLMHMQGQPANMQQSPSYENVVSEVFRDLHQRLNKLREMGVNDVIIDPGFGFGKTVEHNFQLLKNLRLFKELGTPVLAGFSRKSMINKVLGTKPETALNGTTVLNTIALQNGCDILRVHDVKEAKQAVQLIMKMNFV